MFCRFRSNIRMRGNRRQRILETKPTGFHERRRLEVAITLIHGFSLLWKYWKLWKHKKYSKLSKTYWIFKKEIYVKERLSMNTCTKDNIDILKRLLSFAILNLKGQLVTLFVGISTLYKYSNFVRFGSFKKWFGVMCRVRYENPTYNLYCTTRTQHLHFVLF